MIVTMNFDEVLVVSCAIANKRIIDVDIEIHQ